MAKQKNTPNKIPVQLVDPNSKLQIKDGVALTGTKVLVLADSERLQRALQTKIVKRVASSEPVPPKDTGDEQEAPPAPDKE